MGKQRVNILLSVTVIFVAYLAGFFTGRNYNHSPVQVSNLSNSTEATSAVLYVPSTATEILTTEPATQPYTQTMPATEAPMETLPATEAPAQTVSATEIPVQPKATTPPAETKKPTEAPPKTESTAKAEPESTEAPKTEPTVQTEAPTETKPKQTEAPSGSSGLININTASASLLETLPGIGEVIAQRIVDYRNAHGPFKTVYELINVKGIGEKRLAAIINLVTV